ncbi:MAG: hypothetical protein LBT57_00830 [Puniceicoccales bacterium]|jgi:hypothetical protein|nr:hypothetical protein [Puniceicoccales bacterium]
MKMKAYRQDFFKSLFSVILLGVMLFACLGLSVVFLRQRIAAHAHHILSLEGDLQEVELKALSLANHIAQLEAPLHLQFQSRRNFKFPASDQVIRVRNWPYPSRMATPEEEYNHSLVMTLPSFSPKAL